MNSYGKHRLVFEVQLAQHCDVITSNKHVLLSFILLYSSLTLRYVYSEVIFDTLFYL